MGRRARATAGLAVVAVVASGCSGGTGDGESAMAADAPAPPAMTTTLDVGDLPPPEPVLDFDAEEADPPLPHLQDVVADGVADGRWTLPEGVGMALRWAAGEVPDEDLATRVHESGELTGLLRSATEAVDDPDTPDDQRAELQRLLRVLAPSPEAIDAVSAPADTWTAAPTAPADAVVAAGADTRPAPPLAQDGPPDLTPVTEYSFACSGLAADGFDTAELAADDDPCYLWIERVVEGARLRVYYPLEWSEDAALEDAPLALLDAMDVSTQVYARYGEVADVNLAVSQLTDATWPEAHQWTDDDVCQVTVFPAAAVRGIEVVGQTVAHELFHCVQDVNFETTPYDDHAWWMEGSADFFSNVVFPTTNDEHRWIDNFDVASLTSSIFEMRYENTVFFQHLANLYGTQGLWDLLQEVTPGGAGAAEAAMAARGDMEEVFHDFVVFFITGSIADTGGGVLDPGTPSALGLTPIEEVGTHEFEARPFVAARYVLEYASERAYTQTTSLDGGRASGSEKALARDPQEWADLPDIVRTRCHEPQRWPIAVTAVDDAATFTIEVSEVERGICDGCVLGVWELDVPTFEQSMLTQMGNPAGLSVRGSGHVDFADDGTWTGVRELSFVSEGSSTPFGMDAPTAGPYEADGELLSMPDETGALVPAPYTCDLQELVIQAPDFGTIRYVRPPVEDEDDDRVPPGAEPPPEVEPGD